jgi:hypothetical protein
MVVPENNDEITLNLKRKESEEVLEISSTGYGLESVSKKSEKEGKTEDQQNPSCGGL